VKANPNQLLDPGDNDSEEPSFDDDKTEVREHHGRNEDEATRLQLVEELVLLCLSLL
jgi:hypothetical protein